MLQKIKTKIQLWQDKTLAKKLVKRLHTIDKEQWIRINHTFNRWDFPIEFYDIMPKWWLDESRQGWMDRKHEIISPVMEVIDTVFSRKEQLMYHNVTVGKMTEQEFEYWYDMNTKDDKKVIDFYTRESLINSIKWWEDETFEKLSKLNLW